MTVYIVDIEAVDTRYTAQWKTHLPKQLEQNTGLNVKVISGGEVPQATTPGAFLNFGGTNVYKSNQLQQIAELFCNGTVKDGDYFLYTDAWNPTVIQLKYMSSLLGVDIRIGGMWHAGSYDPHDFLGRLIGNATWVRFAEQSMFECYDDNFFATQFHIDMFYKTFSLANRISRVDHKISLVGWPMEYLADALADVKEVKENIILFPHRLAPEKQHDIFKDLADSFPDYQFITAQEKQLTKNEYHTLLAKSKMVFSANLQETLGISWYEGALVGSVPFVPNRLSYSEMATPEVLYPSEWTESWDSYIKHKDNLVNAMKNVLESNNRPEICENVVNTTQTFFSGGKLYNRIKEQST